MKLPMNHTALWYMLHIKRLLSLTFYCSTLHASRVQRLLEPGHAISGALYSQVSIEDSASFAQVVHIRQIEILRCPSTSALDQMIDAQDVQSGLWLLALGLGGRYNSNPDKFFPHRCCYFITCMMWNESSRLFANAILGNSFWNDDVSFLRHELQLEFLRCKKHHCWIDLQRITEESEPIILGRGQCVVDEWLPSLWDTRLWLLLLGKSILLLQILLRPQHHRIGFPQVTKTI